jgi:peptide-methionine (S)-S-oxide reductase
VEAVFSHVKGVSHAVSGYQGGSARSATYDAVSQGDTGHAESVRVTYDPAVIRYDQLLQIFFAVIVDPTQFNRQGPDVGTQYRSALVPLSPEQDKVARAYLLQLGTAHVWKRAIVTRVEPMRASIRPRRASGLHAEQSGSSLYPLLGCAQGGRVEAGVSAVL